MWVVYQKGARLRHIGHLDMMRAMQRALRRSGLPVAYSQGFNPHLLLTFASPLPVGVPGENEVMEAPLREAMDAGDFLARLREALPPDMPCVSARAVDDRHAAPMALLRAAEYSIAFAEPQPRLFAALSELLSRERIPAVRKTKSGDKPCDIRPMIHRAQMEGDSALRCVLALNEAATCKPALLLDALYAQAGPDARPPARVTRTQLYGEGLIPLETL